VRRMWSKKHFFQTTAMVLGLIMLLTASCADDTLPEASGSGLSSEAPVAEKKKEEPIEAGPDNVQWRAEAKQASAVPVQIADQVRTNFGAKIGNELEQLRVRDCIEQERFYDRNASACDEASSIAKFDCTITGISQGMALTQSDSAALNGYFQEGGTLRGYQIDQCREVENGVRVYAVFEVDPTEIRQRYITIER